ITALLVFLVALALTSVGVFSAVIAYARSVHSDAIRDLAGMSRYSPRLAITLAVALLSLAGLPPVAGFFGKLLVLQATISGGYTWLAVVGAVNIVLGALGYLHVVRIIFVDPPVFEVTPARLGRGIQTALGSARPTSIRRPGGHRWLRRILIMTTAGVLTVLVGTGTLLYTYAGELASLDHLNAQSLPQTTRIYARDGTTLLEERYEQRRTVVPLNQIAWDLRHATIAIEDRDFYNQGAVNPVRMLAAGVYDILHQRAAQGGSTITQQLVKNYLLGASANSRSLDRKAKELVLAVELERQYTKDQVLEMYLNTIFYGNQSFGVEAASQTYFGSSARSLTL